MKTSNKFLIAFCLFLFLVPLLGMVVFSKMYYVSFSENDLSKQKLENARFLNTTLEGFTSTKLSKAFTKINITGTNASTVYVYLNEDATHGIKLPTALTKYVTTTIVNGVLNIALDKSLPFSDFPQRLIIIVYSPKIEEMSANLPSIKLYARLDSINVGLQNCSLFDLGILGSQDSSKVKSIADTISYEHYIKGLKLDLNQSTFRLSGGHLRSLSIAASHNSSIILGGDIGDSSTAAIKNIQIKTAGQNQVTIKNFRFQHSKVDFSDSTQLDIPTPILKLLLKN